MIVDAHVHVFRSLADDPERTVDALAPAFREAPLELLRAHMLEAGVDRAVLVPLGREDAYVAGILATNPAEFAGIAVARAGEHDPGVVAARLAAGGFRGLRMFGLPGLLQDVPPWLAVLERLASTGAVLWLYPEADQLDTVDEVAARLPGLTIVLNHCGFTQAGIGIDEFGRPRIDTPVPQPHEERVLRLARHDNVAVMLSGAYGFSHAAYPYPDVAGVVGRLAEAFGPARLAWASDFPWITEQPGYRACLDLVDHHLPGLTPSERAQVLGGTINRLLDWPDTKES